MFLGTLIDRHTHKLKGRSMGSYLTKSPFKAGVPEYWMLTSSPWFAHTGYAKEHKFQAKQFHTILRTQKGIHNAKLKE